MLLTRFFKILAYLFAALFLCGIITQIRHFGQPPTHRKDIDAQRAQFSDLLQKSQSAPDAARQLDVYYQQSCDDYERVLRVTGRFMAVASMLIAGLLSAVFFLWYRLRVLQTQVADKKPPAGVGGTQHP
jgi:hypothetical protein